MSKQRLTRQSWIDAGLTALAEQGPSTLSAEPLARHLGTTKGSFYWHFKDVPAFQTAVVTAWQDTAFDRVASALQTDGSAPDRLRQFGHDLLGDPVELPLRGWATTNTAIAEALAQVDAKRLAYLAALLEQLDLRNPNFAHACLGALIGMPQVPGAQRDTSLDAFDTMIDMVLALR